MFSTTSLTQLPTNSISALGLSKERKRVTIYGAPDWCMAEDGLPLDWGGLITAARRQLRASKRSA